MASFFRPRKSPTGLRILLWCPQRRELWCCAYCGGHHRPSAVKRSVSRRSRPTAAVTLLSKRYFYSKIEGQITSESTMTQRWVPRRGCLITPSKSLANLNNSPPPLRPKSEIIGLGSKKYTPCSVFALSLSIPSPRNPAWNPSKGGVFSCVLCGTWGECGARNEPSTWRIGKHELDG